MDKSQEKIEDIEEAIHLASQADLAAAKEDESLWKLDELLNQLQLQKRLMLEADLRRRKNVRLQENDHIKDPEEVSQKMLEATVKNEENLQIHMVCQKAIETCQYSLALESAENVIEPDAEKTEEELVRLSIEFINVCSKNMSDSRKLESLDDELKKVHEKLKEVQVDISNRKSNPETDAGSKSERIQKLEAQLDKFCGRYDFTRFLTQLLLMASEEDLNNPKIADLFSQCGEAVD